MADNITKLLKAYEQIILIQLDDPSVITGPQQALGLLLNLIIALAATGFSSGIQIVDSIKVIVLIILSWTIFTRIFYRGSNWQKILSLHLNLVTFWIAVTLFLIIAVSFFIKDPLAITPRTIIIMIGLLILIPIHIFRSKLSLKFKLLYIPALWMSNGAFTWATVY